MTNSESTICTYCGIKMDLSAYRSAFEFSSAVFDAVFSAQDAITATDNAIRWANESAERARADWARWN